MDLILTEFCTTETTNVELGWAFCFRSSRTAYLYVYAGCARLHARLTLALVCMVAASPLVVIYTVRGVSENWASINEVCVLVLADSSCFFHPCLCHSPGLSLVLNFRGIMRGLGGKNL